jgi:hypothetical protein
MTTSGVTDKKNGSGMDRISTTAQKVADTVAGVAGEASARLPEAASTTRDALQEANRRVQAGSDETLKVVAALSVGFAGGLLFGGANRLLIITALVPAVVSGATLVDRMDRGSSPKKTVQGA